MSDLSPAVASLYKRPLPSTRTGATFAAHAYPTKIDPAAIALCLLAHTRPGDRVLDCFSGSGSTGIAAMLCDAPPDVLRDAASERLGEDVAWGPRHAELVDLGALPTFLAGTLVSGVDADAFTQAAQRVLDDLEASWGWLYEATAPDGAAGALRHTIWTEHVTIDGIERTVWDAAVRLDPPQIASHLPTATGDAAVGKLPRVLVDRPDPLLGGTVRQRKRSPAFVWGRTGAQLWRRPVTADDLDRLARIDATPLPDDTPVAPMCGVAEGPWGEMYRGGYHQGMSHVHHFYTRRNLLAVAAARRAARHDDPALERALQMWVSSYNTSHATLMTRVVVKKNAGDLVLTSAQPGALYVSGLPVEKNVFAGLQAKVNTFARAFRALQDSTSTVRARQASAAALPLADDSIDYVFTDPPFGSNIQYSEVNFLAEAWLGLSTDAHDEAIVSRFQGKGLEDYRELLTASFRELLRVLVPGGYATVVFHSAHRDVWEALRRAWTDAGFELVASSILDKTQRAFKQVTTKGAVAKDPMVLLRKPIGARTQGATAAPTDLWGEVADRVRATPPDDPARTRDHLWSWLVTRYLHAGQQPPLDAAAFFAGLAERFDIADDGRIR